jgi:hypothetical protein
MLRGTIRGRVTERRRPFMRFFACEQEQNLVNLQLVASFALPRAEKR